jgi:hypothetical protein
MNCNYFPDANCICENNVIKINLGYNTDPTVSLSDMYSYIVDYDLISDTTKAIEISRKISAIYGTHVLTRIINVIDNVCVISAVDSSTIDWNNTFTDSVIYTFYGYIKPNSIPACGDPTLFKITTTPTFTPTPTPTFTPTPIPNTLAGVNALKLYTPVLFQWNGTGTREITNSYCNNSNRPIECVSDGVSVLSYSAGDTLKNLPLNYNLASNVPVVGDKQKSIENSLADNSIMAIDWNNFINENLYQGNFPGYTEAGLEWNSFATGTLKGGELGNNCADWTLSNRWIDNVVGQYNYGLAPNVINFGVNECDRMKELLCVCNANIN